MFLQGISTQVVDDSSRILNRFVGTGVSGFYPGDGIYDAVWSQTTHVLGIDTNAANEIIFADQGNQRIRVVRNNKPYTIAGNGTKGFSGDGGSATSAMLSNPSDVLFDDNSGNMYIADFTNNRIRKVSSSGTITTIAGNGTASSTGDGGLASVATLYAPVSLAMDSYGNLYISEYKRIRKINTQGVISTVKTFSNYIRSISIDKDDNIYVAGHTHHQVFVGKKK